DARSPRVPVPEGSSHAPAQFARAWPAVQPIASLPCAEFNGRHRLRASNSFDRALCVINLKVTTVQHRHSPAQECVTAFVSRKPTEAATTDIHNENSIKPAHRPLADVCSCSLHARVFFW